ncbi:T9SS type A sorting domain-containing protein [Fulvivirgaceae bacterium PWU4]|uniref:T9SS type A sorting domain-containing protein n=1 Tax=Chryseosolibacter histidini TaxID=2782349 RepID=A0AAP2GRY7_9BACT|nr:YCF48-related protein [Chryseosolibacter histidini]MBT1700132.1 T9SS type A sorting domain-containing protein [Chryseosolibacter histidini]
MFRIPALAITWLCLTFIATVAQTPLKNFRSISLTYALGDKVFACADDGNIGNELWVSDGTPEGTKLLKDFNVGYGASGISKFITFKGKVYFGAYTSQYQSELWYSDGTTSGTVMVADLTPPNDYYGGTSPQHFTIFQNHLYFTSADGKLYKTTGEQGNATVVDQLSYTGRIAHVTSAAGKLYYYKGSDILYWTDGTATGDFDLPLDIEDTYFKGLFTTGGQLFAMRGSTYDNHIKLYALNHATNVWTKVFDVKTPTYGNHEITNFTAMGDKLFFTLRKDYDNVAETEELWVTNGTLAGTSMLRSFAWQRHMSESGMENFKVFNNAVYFRSGYPTKSALWKSDGTVAGTAKVHDVEITRPYNLPNEPVIANDRLYFAGTPVEYGAPSLWSTDGTTEGTKFEMALSTNLGGLPHWFSSNGSLVYFVTAEQFAATLWSTAPAPEINVKIVETGQTVPIQASVPFYNTPINGCSFRTLEISNDGKKALPLGSVQVIGSDFGLEGILPEVLQPGEKTSIKVWMQPVRAGSTSGTLTIYSGDDNEGKIVIQLAAIVSETQKGFCDSFKNNLLRYIKASEAEKPIALSNRAVMELQPEGTVVGTFSIPGAQAGTAYALVSGDGDTHNKEFSILGAQLKTKKKFVFGDRDYYTIRVRATLPDQQVKEALFTIEIQNQLTASIEKDCAIQGERLDYGLTDIAVNSEGKLFVITSMGEIHRSDDDGHSWVVTSMGYNTRLSKIIFKGNAGYVLGDNGMLKSDDNGYNWSQLYVPFSTTSGGYSAFFLDEANGYVAAGGGLYYTADGGKTWEVRKSGGSFNDNYNSLWFETKDKGFATTGYDLVKTTDGGKSWEKINLSSLGFLSGFIGVHFLNANEGFLLTYSGFFYTSNGGAAWQKVELQTNVSPRLVRFIDDKKGYMLGSGILYRTTDGGKNWTLNYVSGETTTGLVIHNNKLYATQAPANSWSGNGGRSLSVSADDGKTWQQLQALGNSTHYAVSFPTPSTGFICSSYQNFKTSDGGITWKPVSWTTQVGTAQFLDETTALFSDNKSIYRSTDGGETITEVFTPVVDYNDYKPLGELYAATRDLVFTYNYGSSIYRSTDAGLTWTYMPFGESITIIDMYFLSADLGFVMDLFGSVYKTTDRGVSWTRVYTRDPLSSIVFRSICFVNEQTGYKGGKNFSKTTDGGVTWQNIFVQFNGEIQELNFMTEQHGYVIVNSGSLYETTDGGATWEQLYLWGAEQPTAVDFRDDNIYLVGEEGYVARYENKRAKPLRPGYISGREVVCAGDVQTYSLPVNYGGNYSWDIPGLPVKDSPSSVELYFKNAGDYTLNVRSYNECGASETRTLTVKVEDIDAPVIMGETTVAANSEQIYAIENRDADNLYAWSIDKSTSYTVDDQNDQVSVKWPKAEVETQGTIRVFATNTRSGCRKRGDDVTVNVLVMVGVEQNLAEAISVYPNPADNVINIESSTLPLHMAELHDLNGKVIFRRALQPFRGDDRINVAQLPQGLYVLKLYGQDNIVITKKIVKQ